LQKARAVSLVVALILLVSQVAYGLENPGEELQEVGLSTETGDLIDLNITLQDATGSKVTLEQLMKSGTPTLLAPVYYGCPRLCGLMLAGLRDLLNNIDLKLGEDYQVLTISFDSTESYELAHAAQEKFRSEHTRSGSDLSGLKFFVGDEKNITALMQQIGFNYLEDKGEFAHTAAIMILTAQGEISQYFTGINFSQRDVRLALVEASEGKIGSALDRVLLYCYRFDPTKGRYTLAAMTFMRVGGVLSLLLLGGLVFVYSRKRGQ